MFGMHDISLPSSSVPVGDHVRGESPSFPLKINQSHIILDMLLNSVELRAAIY
jgi:hypothetical protein